MHPSYPKRLIEVDLPVKRISAHARREKSIRPKLLTRALPEVVQKAPHGWRRKRMVYLWFPPGALDDNDMERLADWRERFAQYVLLGLNPNIEEHFSDELDFCMALDYNIDPDTAVRQIAPGYR